MCVPTIPTTLAADIGSKASGTAIGIGRTVGAKLEKPVTGISRAAKKASVDSKDWPGFPFRERGSAPLVSVMSGVEGSSAINARTELETPE